LLLLLKKGLLLLKKGLLLLKKELDPVRPPIQSGPHPEKTQSKRDPTVAESMTTVS